MENTAQDRDGAADDDDGREHGTEAAKKKTSKKRWRECVATAAKEIIGEATTTLEGNKSVEQSKDGGSGSESKQGHRESRGGRGS